MFPGNFRLILLLLLFQCRLLMKIYAFVRSNVPRVLRSTASVTTATTTGNSGFSSSKKSRKSSSESVDESNSPSITTTYSPENSIWEVKEGKLCNVGDDDAAGGVSQVSSSSAENNGGNQEETLDKKKNKNLEGGGGGDNDVGDGSIAGTWTPKATTTGAAGDFPTLGDTQSKLRRRINGINGKTKSFGGEEEERENFEADDNVDELSTTPTKLMSLGGSCDISSENNNNLNGGSWSGSSSNAVICPSFSKYLYFYVAPTLIYKDNYPRYLST